MITLRQQSQHDFLLKLSSGDCTMLADAIGEIRDHGGMSTLKVDVHSTALRVRAPRIMNLELSVDVEEVLRREDDRIVWRMDDETAEGLLTSIRRALTNRGFIPAELAVVQGPQGAWLHLYGEIAQ